MPALSRIPGGDAAPHTTLQLALPNLSSVTARGGTMKALKWFDIGKPGAGIAALLHPLSSMWKA
jgi:hypothetical protein